MAENSRGAVSNTHVQHVFIIGSKSIGQHGEYETFAVRLIGEHENEKSIKIMLPAKLMAMGLWMKQNLITSATRKLIKIEK